MKIVFNRVSVVLLLMLRACLRIKKITQILRYIESVRLKNLVFFSQITRREMLLKQRGVTLLELIFVIAILGIILGLASISFGKQGGDVRRTDACMVLLNASNLMEKYALANGNSYAGASPGTTIPDKSPIDGSTIFYQLTVSNLSATTYRINAIPQAGQVSDACGTLWIDQSGARGADLAIEDCCR